MEGLLSPQTMAMLEGMVKTALADKKAELEAKVLAGRIQTKDVADRMVKAIEGISRGPATDTHRATFSYPDGLRVSVTGPDHIHKVCINKHFRNIPVLVERKTNYYETVGNGTDKLDVEELRLRFTLRREEFVRKDFSGKADDPANHIRILHRRTWKSSDGILQFDMSMVKSKTKGRTSIPDILKSSPGYELEVELVKKDVDASEILASLLRNLRPLLAAYQGSPFLLLESDITRYRMEAEAFKFYNPVTMERRHIRKDRPGSIYKGYTVTNKADGVRSMLFVSKDQRVLRITPSGQITWTGLVVSSKGTWTGTLLDGEYLEHLNMFCIFDVYAYQGKDIRSRPLVPEDMVVEKDPSASRLGAGIGFVNAIRDGAISPTGPGALVIRTKLFLGGDGRVMEEAIAKMLATQFEYETDGLIFTPRGPLPANKGTVLDSVYKWKPPSQNSIDFLVRFKPEQTFDPVLDKRVFQGTLYVSRSPKTDILYPLETMTGEYTPPKMEADMKVREDRAPAPFQPSTPRSPEACDVFLTLNGAGVPVDAEGKRIEDNTIIECSRDVDRGRWKVMRTRYDKTHQYRVLQKPQFGNDIRVAENIWTNIHFPVTEEMLRTFVSAPLPDSTEDDVYYADTLDNRQRVLKDVYAFHNRIKDSLYQHHLHAGETLLEFAVGRAGDLHKWRKAQPKLVVGLDLHEKNLTAPRQGAAVRVVTDPLRSKLPPILFAQADMTEPLLKQDNKYLRILKGDDKATTPYLKTFEGVTEFDVVACQFAIHYACASEEVFRTFVGNLKKHCKTLFFGTCLDGAKLYSLLLGKQTHIFRADGRVFGEVKKEYEDGDGWREEFGQSVMVKLESFEEPQKEYLVPFGKVTAILEEAGFGLTQSVEFRDLYSNQRDFVFGADQLAFTSLHRTFVFTRGEKEVPEETEEEMPEETRETEEEMPDKKEEEEKEPQEEEVPDEPEEQKTIPKSPKEEEVTLPELTDKMADMTLNDAPMEPEKVPSTPAPAPPPKKKRIIKIKPIPEGKEPVLFFMGNTALAENNYLSNMYEAPFQVDGVKFPTVEHYFQWSKAKLFGADATAEKMLKSNSAKTVKALGGPAKKAIEGFDPAKWDEHKVEFMKTGMKAKFTQNAELREKLLATGERPLGEASARDSFWGIGTSAETAKSKDVAKWKKNMTGNLLQELRKELRE